MERPHGWYLPYVSSVDKMGLIVIMTQNKDIVQLK